MYVGKNSKIYRALRKMIVFCDVRADLYFTRDSFVHNLCPGRAQKRIESVSPQGKYFINRMLQLTVRQSTLRPEVPQGTILESLPPFADCD
jgi:hypothetical protein